MRPSPQELVDGIRRVLKEVVEPELTSDHARQRLAETRAALAQVDWDDVGLLLAQRTSFLREILAGLLRAGLLVPAGLLDDPIGTTYAVLAAQQSAFSNAIVTMLPAMEAAAATDPTVQALRGALLKALLQERR